MAEFLQDKRNDAKVRGKHAEKWWLIFLPKKDNATNVIRSK